MYLSDVKKILQERNIEIDVPVEYLPITEIHGKSGVSAKYSYEFRNPKNDMCLIIVTNKKGIYDVTLSSFYKKIDIVMLHNIETNAFYDLLDLFFKTR